MQVNIIKPTNSVSVIPQVLSPAGHILHKRVGPFGQTINIVYTHKPQAMSVVSQTLITGQKP